jgi:cytochrome c553
MTDKIARWVLPTMLLAALAPQLASAQAPSSDAQDTASSSAQSISQREVQVKIKYCSTCHGKNGGGYRGATPIPRLAGQQVEYFKNQLMAFSEKRRENPFMFQASHVLSPAMREALAQHFHDLKANSAADAPMDLVAAGKKIFAIGIPDANVPACASCHGPDAMGNGEFPRLAGQLYAYTKRELINFDKLRGQNPAKPDTSAIMKPIAHSLTKTQISDVAAYLSRLQ